MNSNPIEKGIQVSPAAGIQNGFIDAAKLGRGLNTVFKGYSLIFEALAEQSELLGAVIPQDKDADTQQANSAADNSQVETVASNMTNVAPADTAKKAAQTETGQRADDTPPWEEAASKPDGKDTASGQPEENPAAITVDDLLKIAAQKITTNRKNSPKIKALLTSYGCTAISGLAEDKREAFLNDLAQL